MLRWLYDLLDDLPLIGQTQLVIEMRLDSRAQLSSTTIVADIAADIE